MSSHYAFCYETKNYRSNEGRENSNLLIYFFEKFYRINFVESIEHDPPGVEQYNNVLE